ncbi:hypothetical protein [Sphingomonas gellani]|uniref:hypothetical protein n=1 Tax=Sphingomonas gellani TaxID=1166340 RepID=UPI000B832496|nr:hypothetical protein [Sphingomonas gellani]
MRVRFAAAILLSVSPLGACSAFATRKLEGHVFAIPKLNDIPDSDAPFFLQPLNPDDGFSFYLNPQARLPEQILIGVASRHRMCARAAGTQALINSTVCAATPLLWRGRPLRKVSDGVFWSYNLPAAAGQKAPASLASCSAISGDPRTGLCTANLPFDDLVLTVHFRDDQVGSLASFFDQAAADLRSWEQ